MYTSSQHGRLKRGLLEGSKAPGRGIKVGAKKGAIGGGLRVRGKEEGWSGAKCEAEAVARPVAKGRKQSPSTGQDKKRNVQKKEATKERSILRLEKNRSGEQRGGGKLYKALPLGIWGKNATGGPSRGSELCPLEKTSKLIERGNWTHSSLPH